MNGLLQAASGLTLASDPNAIQRRAADPRASVWVAASAGTGKTKVLADRALSLMLAGVEPQRILCLTFTRAAAAEMNTRITDQLGLWAQASDGKLDGHLSRMLGRSPGEVELNRARQLFVNVLDTPGGLNIQTIHAFCQSLLGRFPLEADIVPHFSVMDDLSANEMLAMASGEVLTAARFGANGLARALSLLTLHIHEAEFGELMGQLAAARSRFSRLLERSGSVERAVSAVRDLLGLGFDETPETIVTAACDDSAFDPEGLRLAVSALQQGSDADRRRAEAIAGWLEVPSAARAASFDAYAALFLTGDSGTKPPKVRETLITKAAAAKANGIRDVLESEGTRLLSATMRRRAARTAQATEALLALGHAQLQAFQRLKASRALLDYDDLIMRAGSLLEQEGGASWVLYKLDGGIDHILIDEAQDTNPEQWQVVRALTGEFFAGYGTRDAPRTVFAVGDVKQSIFGFQGADPSHFLANRDWFAKRVSAGGLRWQPVELTVSFRSTCAMLSAVDAVFTAASACDGVSLDGNEIIHHVSEHRRYDGGSVEVWPPICPRESDTPVPWKPPIERAAGDSPQARLARLIARRIKAMMDGSEVLESRGRPINAGDVMVLVRHRTAFIEELVRALKEGDVPVAGVDRMILTEQMAVMDLIAVGRFALLPNDDLTLAAVLKGPLIGLSEEQLFEIAYQRSGSLWAALQAQAKEDEEYARAARVLSDLLAAADMMPPFEFYARILGALGGRRKLLARLGREAEDPIAEFVDLTLAFERTHTPSLEGFLHWVQTAGVEIKRDLEQSERNAVRVMTVHGAKGLQAPIVFLPDTFQTPHQRSKLFWLQPDGEDTSMVVWPPSRDCYEATIEAARQRMAIEQQQEYRRLLYVAMTRAEDRLIVCGWQGRQGPPADCWYHLIRDGLVAARSRIELEEIIDSFLASAPEFDGEPVVLRLRCPQQVPPQPALPQVCSELVPLPPWAMMSPRPEPEPSRPLVPSRPDSDEPPVRSPFGADDGFGFKRGRLIHRLLQSLPELPPQARAAAAHAWLARPAHRLSPEAQAEIAAEVLAVIDHPEYRELFGWESLAEVPLTGEVAGRVISAQVDRLLVTPDAVTVLDYKTDRPAPLELADVPATYLKQMAAYRAALGRIYPGRRVCCLLLWTDEPRLMAIGEHTLDRHMP